MPSPDPQIAQCHAEAARCAQLIADGHAEQRGLHQALYDWQAEAILRGDGEAEGVER